MINNKCYVGIDLHRKYFTAHAVNSQGEELLKERFSNSAFSVEKMTSSLSGYQIETAVEATRNWEWFVRALTERNCKVSMAHPLKTKAIASARIKTDSIDAKTLCHLLRTDLLPCSYIANSVELENRELSRGRVSLVHDQTHLKNRIMAILGKENIDYEGSDMFGASGRIWLEEKISQSLPDSKRRMVEIFLENLDQTVESIKDVEKLIQEKSSLDPRTSLLTSIPGIGPLTAFLLLAEIGDVNRFKSSKSFASYLGLVPRLSQSGNHAYYGRITKLGNPFVRWSLVQAAHRLARMDSESKNFVNRLSFRGGKKKAIVALARKLSTIVYCVLKENRLYIKNYRRLKVRPDILPERLAI